MEALRDRDDLVVVAESEDADQIGVLRPAGASATIATLGGERPDALVVCLRVPFVAPAQGPRIDAVPDYGLFRHNPLGSSSAELLYGRRKPAAAPAVRWGFD
jgi:hypothetical protein